MKLTVEDNREAIKRYRHIKPAPAWRRSRCGARLSGSSLACTLQKGHSGPHVAHGAFRNVLAVWDGAVTVRKADAAPVRTVSALSRTGLRDTGPVAALKAYVGRMIRSPEHFAEELVFLVFFLAMVGFMLDWALRILGR